MTTLNYAESQRRMGRHPVSIGVVVVLHVLLAWALVSGLARRVVEVVNAPIETRVIEEVKPPPPPPPQDSLPPPPKSLPPPPAYVPPPEVQVAPRVDAPTITTTHDAPPPQEVHVSAAPPAVQAPPAPPRMAARPAIANVQACAPTADDYPSAAARAEATGTTRIRFTVDATGHLASAEVIKSAGPTREHLMLDRVARAKLSECKFSPGQDEAGRPVGGSFEVEYVWTLQ
jgi:periplasmic protein TonB